MSPYSPLRIFLLTASLVSLSSCVSTNFFYDAASGTFYDRAFWDLESRRATNPDKNAIVGMWGRKIEVESTEGRVNVIECLMFDKEGRYFTAEPPA
jgi:hypothetical protein